MPVVGIPGMRALPAAVAVGVVLALTVMDGTAVAGAWSAPADAAGASQVLPSLAELDEGWTTVEPAGRTACAHGTDYAFYVRPGDPDRLMVYLYGGGACWDAEGCAEGSGLYTDRIRPETHPDRLGGILDHRNADNPFADHTMVAVPVCTGDVHLGERDTVYVQDDEAGASAELRILHRGQVNARAAVDWIHRSVSTPGEILVAGSSAGSLAVPLYASRLALHYRQAHVAGVGDDTGGLAGGALPGADPGRWGVPEVLQRHEGWESFSEGWGMEGLFITGAQAAPNLRLFQVNHAHDPVQRFYLERAGTRDPDVQRLQRASIDRIRAQVPEFRSFTLGGFSHTVLQQNAFHRHRAEGIRLRDWIAAVAAGEGVPSVDCGDCLHPSLDFDEDDRRIVVRALEILADDEAWLAQDPGGPCLAEAEALPIRCVMGEAVRQVTGRSPDDHAAPMDLYYLGRAHAGEGPGGPLVQLNNGLNGSAEAGRQIFRDLLQRIEASLLAAQVPAPRLDPSPCPFDLPDEFAEDTDCAWLTVPENWDDPEGRTLQIPVAVLRARAADPRPDALLYLAGGPLPTLVNIEGLARSALRQERDLVLFDYRGLGYGEPVCPDAGPRYLQMLARPLSPEESREATRRLAEECRHWAKQHGVDLAHYEARAMAKDAVAVMESLGYETWSVTGGSFGTAVMQEVLRLDPPGLRAAAMMGPVPLGIEAVEANPMARALELAWRYCRDDPECSATYPDPNRAYHSLFSELNREPIPVPVDGIDGRIEDPFWLDGRTLHRLVLQLLYNRSTLAALPLLIQETARGNPAPVADFIRQIAPLTDQVTGATWAAHCALLGTWAEGFDLTAPARPDDDHFRMEVKLRCPALGLQPKSQSPVESDVPVLIIVGEHDPVTPPAYAHAVAAGLTHVRLLEVPGRGHEMPPECGQVGIPAFLDDPSHIPTEVCVEGLPEVPFVSAPDTEVQGARSQDPEGFAARSDSFPFPQPRRHP